MINFKQEVARIIEKTVNIQMEELQTYIEIPKDVKNGDYAFPCFRLAKEKKQAPQQIANEIKGRIIFDPEIIERVEVFGGYLNFYIK